MSPQVRLQVGALGVRLSTARKSAGVCRSSFPRPGPATPLWLGFQRGGGGSEQDPLAARRLLLQATGRVLCEHAGELVMVARPGEGELHPGMLVSKSRGRAVMVQVEALRERRRRGVACLGLLAPRVHQVVRAERRGHAARRSLRGAGEPRLRVRHHAGHVAFVFDFSAALRHQTHDRSVCVHWGGLSFNVQMLWE